MTLGRLRATVRSLREVPVLGGVVRTVDRIWWWRLIRRSGLVDTRFYAAQLGLPGIIADLAIAHYVVKGFRRGLSLNPLFDEIFAGGGLPEVFRVPALYAYLVGERETIAVHPWWDAVAHGADLGNGTPALERVWRAPSTRLVLRVGSSESTLSVAEMRDLAIHAARDWAKKGRRGEEQVPAPASDAPISLVRFVQTRDRRYHRKLDQAARLVESGAVGASVALVGADASQWISAAILTALKPAVRVRLYPASSSWSAVLSVEQVESAAATTLVVLDARAEFTDAEVLALAEQARLGACVIPAHRAFDGTMAGVGAAHVGAGRPYRILERHPHEDLGLLRDRVLEVPLATGRSFAVPADEVCAVGGVPSGRSNDGELEELSERLRARSIPVRAMLDVAPVLEEPEFVFHRRARRATFRGRRSDESRMAAERILSDAGFDVLGWHLDSVAAVPRLRWRRPSPDAQRWAIKICAPAGRQGAVWGDTHFARGLANALRRRGHTVVIDSFDARDRDTGYLDDVSVVIRGPYRIDAPRWGTSIEWIISHPDEITVGEISGFDRVFAASQGWSRRTSDRWGVPVEPLLEAADTDIFQPSGLPHGDEIVFVGTARGIPRPSVVAPLAAGIPVRVYGPDWRPFIPQSAIAARSIPNEELPARYETASIVLNDQWPAMRREGFIAMRPFDAVAVGGRVISETVDGIEDIFHGAVVTYRDAAHLVELLRADPAELFPSAEQMVEISALIRREHSFDARAAVLEQAAAEVAAGLQRGRRRER